MSKKISVIAGWFVIVLLQIIAAGVMVMLFSGWWTTEEISTLGQFSLIIWSIFLGFVIGVYGVGILSLVLRRFKSIQAGLRFLFTTGCALIPFLALFIIGLCVNPSHQPQFQKLVMEFWQPLLAIIGLALAITGFWTPGWIRKKPQNVQ